MAASLTLKESDGEPRVSATPETVKKMTSLGIKVTVEAVLAQHRVSKMPLIGSRRHQIYGCGFEKISMWFLACVRLPPVRLR